MHTIIADMRQALDALKAVREPDAVELRAMAHGLLDDLVCLDQRWDADHARETAELLGWFAATSRWGEGIAAVAERLTRMATEAAVPLDVTIH